MNSTVLSATPFAALPGIIDERLWLAGGWTMVHFVWVGAAIGLAAWLLRWLLRWFSPQVRYAVSLLALAALVAAPIILLRWQLERIPPPVAVAPSPQAAVISGPVAARPMPIGVSAPPAVVLQPTAPGVDVYTKAIAWLDSAAAFAPWVWIAGAPLMYCLLACGLVGAERLRRRSQILLGGEISEKCRRLKAALRIARPVAVAVSKRVAAPMLVGVLKPLILLPAAMLDAQSAAQIEMILLHELAHVRRWDNLVNLIQRLIEAALFFHPAVWLVSRWVRLEREHCCDEVVLAHSNDPRAYAETLAALAIPGLSPAHAAAAMANHQLLVRIRHILNLEDRRMTLSAKALTVIGSLLVVGGLLVAARAQSNGADTTSDAKPPDGTIELALDGAVLQKLTATRLDADANVDDATFLRRLELDVTGNVPNPDDVKVFVADPAPDKRAKRVGDLLAKKKFTAEYERKYREALAQEQSAEARVEEARAAHARFREARVTLALVDRPKRAWGPEQATGAPDAAMGTDAPEAWASLTPDGQDEWLELGYAEPVDTVAVLVYENCSPGALSQVVVHSADQPGLSFTWTGKDPTKKSETSGISVIPLRVPMKTKKVKLTIDSKAVPGWNEIDAVGLLDRQGKVHWATTAQASSTFADQAAQTQVILNGDQVGLQGYGDVQGRAAGWTFANTDPQGKPAWSPAQATAAPDAGFGTDNPNAWASQDPDGGEEWLKLEYEKPFSAVAILICESFNPGAVRDVIGYDASGKEFPIATGLKPDATNKTGILSIPLTDRRDVASVKLILDTKAVPGWNEIDAVGILDAKGELHWAKSATASSYFGQSSMTVTGLVEPIGKDVNVTWWNDKVHQSTCLSCHADVHHPKVESRPRLDVEFIRHRDELDAAERARADERARLENSLEDSRRQVQELQDRIDQLKSQQKEWQEGIRWHVEKEAQPDKPR